MGHAMCVIDSCRDPFSIRVLNCFSCFLMKWLHTLWLVDLTLNSSQVCGPRGLQTGHSKQKWGGLSLSEGRGSLATGCRSEHEGGREAAWFLLVGESFPA